MSKPAIAILAAVVLATAASAAPRPTGEEKLQKMLAGATPGKPTSCISLTPSQDSTTIEGVGLVYRRGRTMYVNRFTGGCPSLNSFTTVVTRTPSTQLCRGDIARIVDLNTRIEGGSCVFGDFTPYTKGK